jgi:hypothetical protein
MRLLLLSIVILQFFFSAAEASQHVRKRLNNKGGNAINAKYLDLTSEVDQDVLKRLHYRQLDEREEAKNRQLDESMSMSMSMPMSMPMSMSMSMSMSMYTGL